MINQRIQSDHRNEIGNIIPHIVQTACAYKSSIIFEVDEKRVNAKSIMGVMAMASQNLQNVIIHVDGEDEQEAFRAIAGLLH